MVDQLSKAWTASRFQDELLPRGFVVISRMKEHYLRCDTEQANAREGIRMLFCGLGGD